MTELPAPLAAVLEAERDVLNARFAQRLRSGSQIDGAEFLQHLQQSLVPLAAHVSAVYPERTRGVVMALYDVSLDLFAAALLGRQAKLPWVQRVWTDLLPLTTKLLARQPHQVAGSLSNAVYQVASQRGAEPQKWLSRMQLVAGHCQSVRELLDAGKVAAWLAGMVQYRDAALAAAGTLPVPLAARVLGLSDTISSSRLGTVLSRLQRNVWLTVEDASGRGEVEPAVRPVAVAGGFAGFGGLLHRPPVVHFDGRRLLVADGTSQWQLLADAYGIWFCRVGAGPAKVRAAKRDREWEIDRQGTIRRGVLSLPTPCVTSTVTVPRLSDISSAASNDQTFAVTTGTSHHVFLFSCEGSAK